MSADRLPFVVYARPSGLVQAHALFPSLCGAKRVSCWESLDSEPGLGVLGRRWGSAPLHSTLTLGAFEPRW